MPQVDLSVIIPTFNEEANIESAINSVVGWANEIFVVDSYSTDETIELTLKYKDSGVQVVQHTFKNYSDQWNWALSVLPIKSTWTLKLDADERVTNEFKSEFDESILKQPDEVEGVYFRRKFFFAGTPLLWGGMFDNHDLRLWRTGCAKFDGREVNEHVLVKGSTVQMRASIDHRDFKSLSNWIDKHNRYSSMEAVAIMKGEVTGGVNPRFFGKPDERRAFLKQMFFKLPFTSVVYFFYRVIGRFGFLDGLAGINYAFLHACFMSWIKLKIKYTKKTGEFPVVTWPKRGLPHPVVAESEVQRLVDSVESE